MTGVTIKDAIVNIENIRKSTLITYFAGSALIGQEDAGLLVDTIEMISPSTRKIDKIDLFLQSSGGFLDSAYKNVRILKEYCSELNVIVPLMAKSAATVMCLGANEIVMTVFAELGPIDPIVPNPSNPQIHVPARAIRDFFEFLSSTETAEKSMVDIQIKEKMAVALDPYLIGSYQTALKSAKQIAEKLLKENALKGKNASVIDDAVKKLTEEYFSHSFVIDRNEAREIGLNVVNSESIPELDKSVKLLLGIYQQFMAQNNIAKLVGNREMNRSVPTIRYGVINEQRKPISYSDYEQFGM
jgi:membrane-bound ClpP family serine protease